MRQLGGNQWHGDSSIAWGIGIEASLRTPLDTDDVRDRLDALLTRHRHLAPAYVVEGEPSFAELLSRPFEQERLRVQVKDHRVRVVGHHTAVDGLGLLTILGDLTGKRVESGALGLGRRPTRPFVRTALGRLKEAAFAPPAVIAPVGRTRVVDDALAVIEVPGSVRAADLVVAAAAAILARQPEARRIAVAVGASKRPGPGAWPTDESAYLRLRNAERLDVEAVGRALRSQPAEPSGEVAGSGFAARVSALLSRRLGSTILVSHLGEVSGDALDGVAFYPVTGGRSGVSLGAVGAGGSTSLTMRARGGEHSGTDLADLLDEVRSRI